MSAKPIKVFIDDLPLKSGHAVRGIGNYTRNLVAGLKQENKIRMVGLNDRPDIVHYPYFDLFYHTLPIRKFAPTIVTVHDVIPLIFPEHYPPGWRGKINHQLQKIALKNVTAIITDSLCSKKDIAKHLNYPADQIFVTYLAAGDKFCQINQTSAQKEQLRNKYGLPPRFVLYASDINWNKNVINLVRACKKANMCLVIVGKWSQENSFDRTHPENQARCRFVDQFWNDLAVKRLGWVDEEELVKLYNLADVYCQPSYYEGFGLQVLEAMACGCPVVTSNISSLPEVTGEAAVLVDPNSVDEIAKAITNLLTNFELRRTMIEKGLIQVKRFSWQKTVQRTTEVYCQNLK